MITKKIALERFIKEGFIPIKPASEYSSPEIREIALELEELKEKERELLTRLKHVIETDDIS